jgi:hypothetical protein
MVMTESARNKLFGISRHRINRYMHTLDEQSQQINQKQRDRFRRDMYNYLAQYSELMTHAVTLTFNGSKLEALKRKADWMQGEAYERLLQRSFKHFATRLNRHVYGNSTQRHGKTLLILPVIEGLKKDECPHYHCAIGAPDRVGHAEFARMVKDSWSKVAFAGHQIDVQPYRDKGWCSYISEDAVFLNRLSVDWDNVQLPVHLLAHC